MKARNAYAAKCYAEKYEFQCMNPGCEHGGNIEVHHIVPIGKGGADNSDNFISLCSHCHRHSRNHSDFEARELLLATWKYFFESKFQSAVDGDELAIDFFINRGFLHSAFCQDSNESTTYKGGRKRSRKIKYPDTDISQPIIKIPPNTRRNKNQLTDKAISELPSGQGGD